MYKIFSRIFDYLRGHRAVLYISFIGTLALFAFFAGKVRFIEDVYAIIPKDEKTEKMAELFRNSRFADKLTVMVSLRDTTTENPDSLITYADAFAESLQHQAAPYIKSLRYKVESDYTVQLFETIQQHLPVFLEQKDYAQIDSLRQPQKLKGTLANDIQLLSSPTGMVLKDVIANDPSGISFIALKKLQQLQYDESFELYDNYIVSKDHKTLLMMITSVFNAGNTGDNQELFARVDHAMDSLDKAGYANIHAQYFGGALVSAGNATQLRLDTMLTLSITVIFLILFIGFYFRKKRAPALLLLPVVYGALFSLACIYFIKGSISVIAIGTGSIVLGVAVNYSLHVFNHYRHTGDLQKVIRDLSFPMTVGSFTTIFGFFSLQWAASDMLKDLGLFAGFSLIGSVLCSLIFLPHFIGNKKQEVVRHSFIDRIASVRLESNKWLVAVILLLTVGFYFFAQNVRFESDMTQLNYMKPPLKQAEQRLNALSGAAAKSVYLVSEGKNLDDALLKYEAIMPSVNALKDQGHITAAAGVGTLYLSDSLQKNRITFWNTYWTQEKKGQLLKDITRLGVAQGFKADAFNNFKETLYRDYNVVDKQLFEGVRQQYLDDYISEMPDKTSIITLLKVPGQYKADVQARLDAMPGSTVLDRQYLTNRLTEMVKDDFNNIAWIVSIIVAVVLLLTYGRIELMLMSFIPMLISWIWILGIMAITDIKFNIVNIIISTLIFGLGDDYSLFVMDGLLSEYKTGKKNLASYKSSILLSAITTIAGLGVLIFAKHPALRSIAFISVTGILCVVLMSQVLIPFFFNLVVKKRVLKGFHPWTLLSWLHSVISFLYFGFVSVLLTIIGLFLIKLKIIGKNKGEAAYHWLLSKLCMSVMFFMGRFKKRIINEQGEDFAKPAVVIANHQSFLDILMMAMLSPRLILLTNKWVWNSPVFGWAIKMANFYPVANGIENSVDLLGTQIKKGFSIVVFPEGTRSSLPPMKRFHKGAFYLAEKLNVDIVPVVLHGLGYTMSKGDYLLKNGDVAAKYLPRISADDAKWGNNYQERTKNISRYFKSEHEHLRAQLETPKYFKEHLLFNYIYKGPVLEWYLKIKLRLEGFYQSFHELLPMQGNMLDLGCGYGFMTYILYWASNGKRRFTSVDYDEEKMETADHCFGKTSDLQFVHADISRFTFEKYDGIVISDVLHYLLPEEQNLIIRRAIDSLNPNGVLVIRDGDKDMQEKHKGTKLTEFFSTRLLAFNKTAHELYFISGKTIESLAREKGLLFERIDDTKYTSNVIWVLKKHP
ncbi:MAG: 1-acyl-sn-glycerol-3-phosphate acyltransferase [Niabella sp.]